MTMKSPKPKDPLFIVGLGASAGGLESFENYFAKMPTDTGFAFVVITHLDPTHKSILTELIGRFTKMPAHEAKDNTKVLANNVYVLPPNKDMSIFHGTLQLFKPHEPRGLRHPIDFFFRSLAEDQGDRAVCVVLSGTGSEGALGLKAVKERGGLTMAEDPATAKYDGMPANAVATGLVDYVMPAEALAEQLLKFTKRFPRDTAKPDEKPPKTQRDAVEKIYTLVRNKTGHDFSGYKPATVIRRIHRRMAVLQIDALDDYITYLRSHPDENDAIFKELLIRVTNFFRDPEAYEALKVRALPEIFQNRDHEHPVRVWVPGCATGEEAYSLAMVIREYMDEVKGGYRVQIFATDIDSEAIDTARRGVYQEHIAADVSNERLNRFFTKVSDAFKVKDDIRESVIFATQNLAKDPPFSHLDLVSCRNVLIYFKPELQQKIFSEFFYALKPRGYMLLGSSETVGKAADLFTTTDKKWKIFKTKSLDLSPRHSEQLIAQARPAVGAPLKTPEPADIAIRDITENLLLERYSPAAILVNENGDILFFHGRTGKYLEPPSGRARLNIDDMAREGLLFDLKSGIQKAIASKQDVTVEGIRVRKDGGFLTTNAIIQYIKAPERLSGLLLVAFTDSAESQSQPPASKSGPSAGAGRVKDLEAEIMKTRERLQHTIEELEAANEELKSSNEEQQSSNEELQSTNEELETSKEELQATNEELMLVNSEMQHKVDELFEANSDLDNLMVSTDIATVFLDKLLHVRRFTPPASRVVSLIQSDIGRPFSDITTKLDYPDLNKDMKEVLTTFVPKEKQVRDVNGVWYLVRILSYRSIQGQVEGLVITFTDIDALKKLQITLTDTLNYANGIIETAIEPLVVLDSHLQIVSANPAFMREFGLMERDTHNKLIYEVGDGALGIPAFRQLLETVLPDKKNFENFELTPNLKKAKHKKFLVNGTRIPQRGKQSELVLLSMKAI